jgi:hypothetical protein
MNSGALVDAIVSGVPFGRQSPRKQGPYSVPIHTPALPRDLQSTVVIGIELGPEISPQWLQRDRQIVELAAQRRRAPFS